MASVTGRFTGASSACDGAAKAIAATRGVINIAGIVFMGSSVPHRGTNPGRIRLTRVLDDADIDDLADEDDLTEEDDNGHTLSIRRANGEEVLTVFSPTDEWSVYLEPGGAMTNAFVGTPGDPLVWVN